ncbi:TetR/AcrR family transcriptional regulator [Glutamicibacter sp. NPDC087344]|uniref:TetR/AcrR family transcriptional regulator n=1 Tax=Glutamicibacter sp. NPDC087344 TaxID=3363994 RepID=UPI0037FB6471
MSLSRSALKICEVAVKHFAQFGYDASSLAAIAEAAGMRKPSLYAHFAGKDALFLQVLEIALTQEKQVIRTTLVPSAQHLELPGFVYLDGLEQRYADSSNFRFLLRTVYAPPVALREEIITKFHGYESELRQFFAAGMGPSVSENHAKLLTEAFLGVVDSLQVELIYNAPQTYRARKEAMCQMLAVFAGSLLPPQN